MVSSGCEVEPIPSLVVDSELGELVGEAPVTELILPELLILTFLEGVVVR